MDELLNLHLVDRLGGLTVLAVVAICVITGRLVWHTQLKKAEDRADRWESIALEALRAGAQAGVEAAEVTAAVVSAMPDPANKQPEGA